MGMVPFTLVTSLGCANGNDFNQALLEALVEGQSGSGSDVGH